MNFDPQFLACADISGIALVISADQHVLSNRSASIILKLRSDVVPARAHFCLVAFCNQPLHVLAVRHENLSIVGIGPSSGRQPPYVFDAIFNPKAPNVDPFSWRWELRGVVPKTLLSKIKTDLIDQGDQKFEVIQRSGR